MKKKSFYIKCFFLAVSAGIIGILSRKFPEHLPSEVIRFTGDTMWAFALYYLLRIFFSGIGIIRNVLFCFSVSVIVEISQLYQADWINAIRATLVGALVLGNQFLWSDLGCYLTGAVLAGIVDLLFFRKNNYPDQNGL